MGKCFNCGKDESYIDERYVLYCDKCEQKVKDEVRKLLESKKKERGK